MDTFTHVIRLLVIALGFVTMFRLWQARRRRKEIWTTKMRDIWIVQFGWACAAVEANVELFYRRTPPSLAIILVIFLLLWTIKGTMGDKYTINQL